MAKKLGKFRWEVQCLPVDEFDGWVAFFEWEYHQERKANEKAKSNSNKKSNKSVAGGNKIVL